MGQLVFQANAGGQTALIGPNPSSNFSLNVPAVNGTLVTTGDTGTVTNTMLASNVYTAPGTIGSGTPNTGAFTSLSASSVTDSGLTAGRVNYNGTGGLLVDSSNLTFDGSTLTTLNSAYTGTLTGGTGIVNLGSGQFYKDASGYVGIGVTPSAWSTSKAIQLSTQTSIWNYAGTNTYFSTNEYYNGTNRIFLANGYALEYQQAAGSHIWSVSSASGTAGGTITLNESMRIDSSGNLLVGTTSVSTAPATGFAFNPQTSGAYAAIGHTTSAGGGSYFVSFGYNGGVIGTITQAGTTGVLYNVTSDYRLKNDVAPIQNALTTVEALNPVSFTWIDGRKDDGFIAHEIQAVIPNCVTGEKDAVNEDGTPKYQQMDSSGVIPFLVKAIQELNAKVDAQAAEIIALQTKVGA